MNDKLFRKSSLERVNSPEQLNEYIRVARPGVWIVLSAIALLLLGVIIWSVFGSVESTVGAAAVVKNGETTLYISPNDALKIERGMKVYIQNEIGVVEALPTAPSYYDASADIVALGGAGMSAGELLCAARVGALSLADGAYAAQVVVESIHPIRFVMR